ncbi:MAG TPA: J domain-containing protein [Pyrinomonadaceae bacterium]|jgi:hypothetical protein
MSFQIIIKPISKWIGSETKHPGNSQFKQTYSNTKTILQGELSKLGALASTVQLEMFIRPEDLRSDGELRANAKPYRQGVVLSFSKVKRRYLDEGSQQWKNELQTLSYPCDTYNDWKDNLRAIALSLQKLRDVARYGVFKYEDMVARLALPSAEGKVSTAESAAEFLAKYSDYKAEEILYTAFIRGSAYKQAATKLHPDKNGGSTTDDFLKLQDAKRILGI